MVGYIVDARCSKIGSDDVLQLLMISCYPNGGSIQKIVDVKGSPTVHPRYKQTLVSLQNACPGMELSYNLLMDRDLIRAWINRQRPTGHPRIWFEFSAKYKGVCLFGLQEPVTYYSWHGEAIWDSPKSPRDRELGILLRYLKPGVTGEFLGRISKAPVGGDDDITDLASEVEEMAPDMDQSVIRSYLTDEERLRISLLTTWAGRNPFTFLKSDCLTILMAIGIDDLAERIDSAERLTQNL